MAGAGLTSGGLGAGLGAAAVAGLAGVERGNTNACLGTLHRVFKREFERIAQVGTALGAAARAATAEDVAEHIAEDVGKVGVTGTGAVKPAGRAGGSRRIDTGMTELVVGGAFLRVRQNLVGLFRFLELGLGGLVARIAVGVELHGKPPVGLLDLGLRRVARDPERFVVVPFGHNVSSK